MFEECFVRSETAFFSRPCATTPRWECGWRMPPCRCSIMARRYVLGLKNRPVWGAQMSLPRDAALSGHCRPRRRSFERIIQAIRWRGNPAAWCISCGTTVKALFLTAAHWVLPTADRRNRFDRSFKTDTHSSNP